MNKLFDKIFPFHLIIDRDLRIIRKGRSTSKLIPVLELSSKLADCFLILRPHIEFSFEGIQQHENAMFLLQSISYPDVQVKGQMSLLEDDSLLFVFTPIVREVSFLQGRGINMNDIPFYDNTLEFLFALQAVQHALTEAQEISKSLADKVDKRTFQLKVKNEEMHAQYEEYIQQQEQLNDQSLFLAAKNRKLQKARELIHSKNRELKLHSVNLEKEVKQRTQDLTAINRELVDQNNQLEQFAFIVAHNLRAPIARILGLVNLMRLESLINDSNEFYVASIAAATQRLEEVIKDLNIILEIRKGVHQAYEPVFIPLVIDRVKETLKTQLEESKAVLNVDVNLADAVYSVKSYIENILYNLISNALKYRSPHGPVAIDIKSFKEGSEFCLIVSDNGIGFDAKKNKDSVFKIYKRFHDHVEGKGLGLYMIKTQITALGGRIEVESEPGAGAKFSVYIDIDR